jgi:hypothetical protein
MDRKRIKDLNDRQRFWLDHLRKCLASEKKRRVYARVHSLNYSTLEKMRIRFEKMGVLEKPIAEPPDGQMFKRVFVTPTVQDFGPIRLTLPNGVQVLVEKGLDRGGLDEILTIAARVR